MRTVIGDSFGTLRHQLGHHRLKFHAVTDVAGAGDLPVSHKILLENLLRHEDGVDVTTDDVTALVGGDGVGRSIDFFASRAFLHDTNGVPVLTDLAAMRDAVARRGGDPALVDPVIPAELTVDHSVSTDFWARADAPELNVRREYERNAERYEFLQWGQKMFAGLTVIPPGAGIMHQINVEHLAQVVTSRGGWAMPDTVAGTDSHTTMVNGLGVLAWGVGGIEATAAMLGQPISMLVPPVVGVELTGRLGPGVTATDLVLTLTERLREEGVVGCFVEFHGEGVAATTVASRCTIANMSPEFGSTAALFPIDERTLDFLRLTGRAEDHVDLVEQYTKAQGLWLDPSRVLRYDRRLVVDLSTVGASLAGPRRPQDRVDLHRARESFRRALPDVRDRQAAADPGVSTTPGPADPRDHDDPDDLAASRGHEGLRDGAVAIASITSCTNTSNPSVMIAAGLLARNAARRGLHPPAWVKTSLAPGSRAVTDYLDRAGLLAPLAEIGFDLVGYGCMTCIGNSGGLAEGVAERVRDDGVVVASVLSGNRNFDGRINNEVSMNYLASPPLVVAYALAGTLDVDLTTEPLGADRAGNAVHLAELWPDDDDVQSLIDSSIDPLMYQDAYAHLLDGDVNWQKLEAPSSPTFSWQPDSTYLQRPPWLERPRTGQDSFQGARALLALEDSVTTDHICPAGRIPSTSPAGQLLISQGVDVPDLNTYASRRGNWQVMERAGFANRRLVNRLVPDGPGGTTLDQLDGTIKPVYEAAAHYRDQDVPQVVLAGTEYGTGSSRDWAAKVTALLGVRAVIAGSFERIHRSNLVAMGVLPLELQTPEQAGALDGTERFDLEPNSDGRHATVVAHRVDGTTVALDVRIRVDTSRERDYVAAGGILPFILGQLS